MKAGCSQVRASEAADALARRAGGCRPPRRRPRPRRRARRGAPAPRPPDPFVRRAPRPIAPEARLPAVPVRGLPAVLLPRAQAPGEARVHGAADERGGRAGGGVPDLREVRGAVPPRPRPSRRRARRVSRSQCRAAPTRGIRVPPGEDADVMWARHASTSECDPANYDRVNRKPRCMAAGCREKLTFSNRFDCKVRRAPSVSAAPGRPRGAGAASPPAVFEMRGTRISTTSEFVVRPLGRARGGGEGAVAHELLRAGRDGG